jgi:hypothetical protein
MGHHSVDLLVLLFCIAVLCRSETPMRRLIAWTHALSGVAVAAVVLAIIAVAVIGLLPHK